jgi:hypothetical protein
MLKMQSNHCQYVWCHIAGSEIKIEQSLAKGKGQTAHIFIFNILNYTLNFYVLKNVKNTSICRFALHTLSSLVSYLVILQCCYQLTEI